MRADRPAIAGPAAIGAGLLTATLMALGAVDVCAQGTQSDQRQDQAVMDHSMVGLGTAQPHDSANCREARRSLRQEQALLKRDEEKVASAIDRVTIACYRPTIAPRPRQEVTPTLTQPGARPDTPAWQAPQITNCDANGCWDSKGTRYNKSTGSLFIGPTGSCQKVGVQMRCN